MFLLVLKPKNLFLVFHSHKRNVILLGRDDVIADRSHVTVCAYQVFEVTDVVRESDVVEGEHVVDFPVVLEALRLELVGVSGVFLVHQRQGELGGGTRVLVLIRLIVDVQTPSVVNYIVTRYHEFFSEHVDPTSPSTESQHPHTQPSNLNQLTSFSVKFPLLGDRISELQNWHLGKRDLSFE